MRAKGLYVAVLMALLVALAGCAPRATPVPTPTAVSPQAAPAVPAPTAPSLSPEEAAWQKVVAAAKKEGRLTVYSFNLVGDFAIAVARAFKDRYGIDVDIVAGGGAVFVERLKTEKRIGKMTGDIMEGSPTIALTAKGEGLTIPIPDLPVLKENAWLYDPFVVDRHLLSWMHTHHAFYANMDLVKVGELPTSYYDILDPRWKGKLVTLDPAISGLHYSAILTLINRGLLKPDYIDELVKQKPALVPTSDSIVKMLASKQYPLTLHASVTFVQSVKEGVPIRLATTKEGTVTSTNVIILIKDSPHPNAAQVFANWYLSQESARLAAEKGAQATIRKDVPSGAPASLTTDKGLIILTGKEYETNADAFAKKLWADKFK